MEIISRAQCLRCAGKMESIGVDKIQLGPTGWIWGNLSNLMASALEVEIYVCKGCGKVEFFQAHSDQGTDGEAEAAEGIAQVNCPQCGKNHDMDYPKCPFCKYDYRT